jgi:hypothetical protein
VDLVRYADKLAGEPLAARTSGAEAPIEMTQR